MALRFLDIKITGGTSPGLYDVYYDTIKTAFLVSAFTQTSTSLVKDKTLSEMESGLIIGFPDSAGKIILYNQKCKTSQIFDLDPVPVDYPGICLIIFDLQGQSTTNFEFTYSNSFINNKPVYTYNSYNLIWNTNGYWDLSGYTSNGTTFRSTDSDNIPQTNWEAIGSNSNNFAVVSQTGNCSNVVSNFVFLSAEGFDADCGASNGSIFAKALGGSGTWEYSIDGQNFQSTGSFTLLNKGTYIVVAKDTAGTTVSEIVVIDGPVVNEFSLQAQSQSTKKLSKIGFTQFYETTIIYDTSFIPVGETITFNYVMEFNLNYVEPGSAKFDVQGSNLTILKNSMLQGIPSQVDLQNLTEVGPSICDPLYSLYQGFVKYKTGQISLDNNDSFEVKFVYGINTEEFGVLVSAGGLTTPCFTQANVNISSYVTDVQYSCDCCKLIDTTVTTSINQIYQS
jgi:hypothetical protein